MNRHPHGVSAGDAVLVQHWRKRVLQIQVSAGARVFILNMNRYGVPVIQTVGVLLAMQAPDQMVAIDLDLCSELAFGMRRHGSFLFQSFYVSLSKTKPPPRRRPVSLNPRGSGALLGLGLRVLAAEALHAASRIDKALLAGEERVAGRADFDVNVALVGRTGLKVVSAGADYAHSVVIGVNLFLRHGLKGTFPAILFIIRRFLFTSNDETPSQSRFAGLEFLPKNFMTASKLPNELGRQGMSAKNLIHCGLLLAGVVFAAQLAAAQEITAHVKQIYKNDCALCHGDNGNGKSEIAESMKLTLLDYTDPKSLAGKSDQELFDAIRKGRGDKMPPEDAVRAKDAEVRGLVAYVRSLSKGQSAGQSGGTQTATAPAPPPGKH